MNGYQIRKSNFELLRIIATFFIIIVHSNGWFLVEFGGINDWNTGGCVACAWRIAVQSVTCVGVDIFVLISGYFSIRPKVKSIVNLYTLLVFFYMACYCLDCIAGSRLFTLRGVAKNFFAFSCENWFIQCYIFLMLLSPMVNVFMESLNEKKALFFVLLFIFLAFYFGCIRSSKYFYFNGGYSVTSLLLIYIVGRYIRLFGERRIRTIGSIWLVVLYCISVILIGAILLFIGNETRWLSYCSPIVILSSAILFLLFARLDLQSNFINWIGKSCLAVFIVHTCSPVIGWISNIDVHLFLNKPLFVWIASMSGIICTVFIASIGLDKVRILLSRPLIRCAEHIDSLFTNYVR